MWHFDVVARQAADLIKRAQVETGLRISEERFRALAVTGADVIYRMSPDWSAMYPLRGHTPGRDTTEAIPDWLDRFILADDQPTMRAAIQQAIEAKTLFELEHRIRKGDGKIGWRLSRAVPILANDGERGDVQPELPAPRPRGRPPRRQ